MIEEFEVINPWWYSDNWEREDKHLKEWESQEIKWLPSWITKLSTRPFSLNFVMGPRQVGKTTGLKFLIKSLIEKGIDPERIFYLDVGLISSLERLKRLIFSLSKESFIFLDEVTSLEDWWKVIRAAIDAGVLKDKVVTVTGSASLRLKKHAEFFPGRIGYGSKVEVLSLSFPEYVKVKHGEKKLPESMLNREFKKYLACGGFPLSINLEKKAYADMLSAFESEFAKANLDLDTCYQIVSSLLEKIPSSLSYQAIGGNIGVSYKTVEYYLKTLRYLYVLEIAHWKQNNRISFRKEKKIFFRDPFLYHTFSFWTGKKFLDSALFEGVIQEHLLRKFGEIYYYRNHYEIDCIAGKLKVEVKAGKPHKNYPKGVRILEAEEIPRFLFELSRNS